MVMMGRLPPIARWFLVATALLYGQEWQTAASLPMVDLGGLNAAQKATVLRILRGHDCTCGCKMKLAECRMKDPGCTYSRGLASLIADSIKSGKSASAAVAAADASRFAHP